MKKYLFIALAALGFAACAEKMDDNSPVQKGELEESYIAINLMSADLETRAAEDTYGYEDGTDDERKIKSAYFFFFDENGQPFNVLGAPATAPGGNTNYLTLQLKTNKEEEDVNVSDISEAVLILNTYKGIYPKQIVAVLNWTPLNRTYSLKELRDNILEGSLGNDEDGYVMTNSVYMDDARTKVIDAAEITAAHIQNTAELATNNPVQIYVERTAAKVVVTLNPTKQNDGYFKVTEDNGFKPLGRDARDVYVSIKGWELYNEFTSTNLLKSVSDWDVDGLGLTWNDYAYRRSYWANTMNVRSTNDKFQWDYGTDSYGHDIGEAAYCGENTLDWKIKDVRTKVILKGRLYEKVNGNYQSLDLARWYGNEYAGAADLKTAVANSLAYTLFSGVQSGEETIYSSITADDIEIVHGYRLEGVETEGYQVRFQLTTAGAEKTWYRYSSETKYVELGDDKSVEGYNTIAMNAELAKVAPATWYESGNTYYIVDIRHLANDVTKTAAYGLVRNHVYQIDIKSIKGYGSPGYAGVEFLVPEYPVPVNDTYVAAQINVLSWKVVKQGVDIVVQ